MFLQVFKNDVASSIHCNYTKYLKKHNNYNKLKIPGSNVCFSLFFLFVFLGLWLFPWQPFYIFSLYMHMSISVVCMSAFTISVVPMCIHKIIFFPWEKYHNSIYQNKITFCTCFYTFHDFFEGIESDSKTSSMTVSHKRTSNSSSSTDLKKLVPQREIQDA